MPRTTLDLDQSVLDDLRRLSRREGKSLGQVASEALAQAMGEPGRQDDTAFAWITADLGEPVVDLEDKEALHALLDGR